MARPYNLKMKIELLNRDASTKDILEHVIFLVKKMKDLSRINGGKATFLFWEPEKEPELNSPDGCPPEQISTCEGCTDIECLEVLEKQRVCIICGEEQCLCQPVSAYGAPFWWQRVHNAVTVEEYEEGLLITRKKENGTDEPDDNSR